jgi:hypothetical protein
MAKLNRGVIGLGWPGEGRRRPSWLVRAASQPYEDVPGQQGHRGRRGIAGGPSRRRGDRGDAPTARGRVRTCESGSQPEVLRSGDTQIDTQGLRREFNICQVIAAWPSVPAAIQVLAILQPYARGLSINRGSESANGAKVAAVRAAKRQSSFAGAKPEQLVCGQVGPGGSSR